MWISELHISNAMAPKRKNKKPAPNPARGFATTSTASKAKSLNEGVAEVPESGPVPEIPNTLHKCIGDAVHVERDLHEMSPEELEKQLEESDLNLFLERHTEKIQRDVTRQINRLRTEKRLLRAQADLLQTRSWLSSEIMELIIDIIKAEHSDKGHSHQVQNASNDDNLSEDDLCVKVWTLKQVLVQLGFSYELSQEAVQSLLSTRQDSAVSENLTGKDSVWGLNHCLDWLALHCETQQAPSYVHSRMGTETGPLPGHQQRSDAKLEHSDSGK